MEAADMKRFAMIMWYLSLNFPEREVREELIYSYFRDLSGFSIDDVETAAMTYVQTGSKFPLLSDLNRLLSA